jgi:hypothetical protein
MTNPSIRLELSRRRDAAPRVSLWLAHVSPFDAVVSLCLDGMSL